MRDLSTAWPGAAALLGLLAGCEPMPSSGNPFAPAVTAPADAAAAPDPRFDRPEPKVYTSEQLHAEAEAAAAASAPPAPVAELLVTSGEPVGGPAAAPAPTAEAPVAPVVAPPAPAAPPPATAGLAAASPARGLSAWPMRLVRALPDTNPPRAILGLPDGREVVVSPGTMLPEHGVVVMAIGRDRLQVARIDAVGDHAAVTELTLDAQY